MKHINWLSPSQCFTCSVMDQVVEEMAPQRKVVELSFAER